MKKRRHRMLVEMYFDKPVAEEIARSTCERVFSGQDFQRIAHEQATRCGATLVKHEIKDAERVFQQDARRVISAAAFVAPKIDDATFLSIMEQESSGGPRALVPGDLHLLEQEYDRLYRATSGDLS